MYAQAEESEEDISVKAQNSLSEERNPAAKSIDILVFPDELPLSHPTS